MRHVLDRLVAKPGCREIGFRQISLEKYINEAHKQYSLLDTRFTYMFYFGPPFMLVYIPHAYSLQEPGLPAAAAAGGLSSRQVLYVNMYVVICKYVCVSQGLLSICYIQTFA